MRAVLGFLVSILLLAFVAPPASAFTDASLTFDVNVRDSNRDDIADYDIQMNDTPGGSAFATVEHEDELDIADGNVLSFASASAGPGLSSMRAFARSQIATTPLSTDDFSILVTAVASGSDRLLIDTPVAQPGVLAGFMTLSLSLDGTWTDEITTVGAPDPNAGQVRSRWRVGAFQNRNTVDQRVIGLNGTIRAVGGDLVLDQLGDNTDADILGDALQVVGGVPITGTVGFTFGEAFDLDVYLEAQVSLSLDSARGLDVFGEADLGQTLTLNPIVEIFADTTGDGMPDLALGSLPILSESGIDYTVPEPGAATLLLLGGLVLFRAPRSRGL